MQFVKVDNSGIDFVFIDTEHTPIGRETLSWMCRAYAAVGLPPVVRIPSPDPFEATKVLDGGAGGVMSSARGRVSRRTSSHAMVRRSATWRPTSAPGFSCDSA